MQLLIIAGNVGKDAKLNSLQSGDAVLSFRLAVDNGKDRDGNKRDATWYDCALWGKRAESLERHILKGSKLSLSGRPTVRVHEGKAYLGITVSELTFMGSSQASGETKAETKGESNQERQSGGGYDERRNPPPSRNDLDDEIPF